MYLELRSLSQLEIFLMKNSIKSRSETSLGVTQLALILKNPTYVKADERVRAFYQQQGAQFFGDVNGHCGLMTYGKTHKVTTKGTGKISSAKSDMDKWIISVGPHPGLIDADIWLEAQKILAENADKFPQSQKSHTALLSGILRCDVCGSRMGVVYGHKKKDGKVGYYYHCIKRQKSKGQRGTNRNARADLLDAMVIEEIKNKHVEKDVLLESLQKRLKQDKSDLEIQSPDSLRKGIAEREKQIERLRIRVRKTDDEATAVEYEADIKSIRKEIGTLNTLLSEIGEKKTAVFHLENTLGFLEKLIDKCGVVDTLDLEEQRELVRVMYTRVLWNAEDNALKFHHVSNDDDENGDVDGWDSAYAPLEAVVMKDDVSHNSTLSCEVIRDGEQAFVT
jgi:TfoX/Sxy family transcriptional regulator of competence genes